MLFGFRDFLFRFVEDVQNSYFLLVYLEVQGLCSLSYFFNQAGHVVEVFVLLSDIHGDVQSLFGFNLEK